jgi:hypothetical protein
LGEAYLLKTDLDIFVRWDFRIALHDGRMAIIEYNGIQHFEPVNWSGQLTDQEIDAKFERTKHSDELKANFCREKGWPILWIDYSQLTILKELVCDFLDQHRIQHDANGLLALGSTIQHDADGLLALGGKKQITDYFKKAK